MKEPAGAIVTVRLDDAIAIKLEALARRTGQSSSDLAAAAIAAYVELDEWQIAETEAGIAELDSGRVVTAEEAATLYERLCRSR